MNNIRTLLIIVFLTGIISTALAGGSSEKLSKENEELKMAYASQEINRIESTEAISALGDAPTCDPTFQAGQRQFNQALADAESAFNKIKLFNSTYADFKETVTTQEGFDLEEALEARYDQLKEVSDGLAALCS